jgi:outer membrane cobalamin receptor
LTVNPIERLSFDVNYTLRARRSMPFDYPNALQWEVKGRSGNAIGDIPGAYDYYQAGDIHTIDLKNASLLSVGATYRINDPFSVFVRGENLLNNRSQTVALMPRTGITGLFGFTYKF